MSTGGSCIIGPLGQVLAGPVRDGEEVLFALLVDTRVKHPVDWLTGPEPPGVEPRAGARQGEEE